MDSLLHQLSGKGRGRVYLISSLQRILLNFGKLGELIFFPSFCLLCSSLLESTQEKVVCRACWEKVKIQRQFHCLCCGRFFQGAGESHFCPSCIQKRPPFSLHRSCGNYKGSLKDIILLFKYRHFGVLGKELARFANRVLSREKDLWWKVEVVLPVPLHRKRKRQRGFNQAQVIARELARLKGIEMDQEVLVKIKNIPPQTSLDADDRRKNVSGAYRVKNGERIKGKVVLLVDDVYTTGATIRECSRVLRKAGAKEVRALTLAQA